MESANIHTDTLENPNAKMSSFRQPDMQFETLKKLQANQIKELDSLDTFIKCLDTNADYPDNLYIISHTKT